MRKPISYLVKLTSARTSAAFFVAPLAALAVAGWCASARAQETSVIDKIATYQGADREKILEDGAHKEGTLTFYTAMVVDQAIRPLVAGFEKRYPYIKVQFVREDPPPKPARSASSLTSWKMSVSKRRLVPPTSTGRFGRRRWSTIRRNI